MNHKAPLASVLRAAALALVISMFTCSAATQWLAAVFDHQRALGASLAVGEARMYWPWMVFAWDQDWSDQYVRPFAIARLFVFVGVLASVMGAAWMLRVMPMVKPFGTKAWGTFSDAVEAGLFAENGAVLGKFEGEILAFEGSEHQLLIGASRSGKGRGQVVPTLLTWPHAALVLDVKGELADGDGRHSFPGTAGFREQLGPVLRFAPTRQGSAAFNPLFEVRKGANEVRDVQNIVEILVDPQGDGRNQDFWDRSAKAILVGLILHVMYAEPDSRKTLAIVREKLRDLDATALAMKSTLHRLSPISGAPEVHPEVLHAAESFLAGEDRLKAGVRATAESFFGIFADEIVASNTSRSDFRIGDLMCGERPVTLFLQPPPSDAIRLTPLLRLLINQIARSLMEDQSADAVGRPKRHRLMLVLDEFPMLGRMPFFETMMGAMAGYGLKAFLVTQSLNHLTKAYGRDNVILDNCHIVTSFSASDGETARRIAEMAGEVWELRESETHQRPRRLLSPKGSTTIREERRALLLPGDVRSLPRDEQLIFVAGAKPFRAKKLKFDHEPIFRQRLMLSGRRKHQLTTAHDWENVSALGVVALPAKKSPARPVLASTAPPQPDLFGASGAANSRASPSGVDDALEKPFGHSSRRVQPTSASEERPPKATRL